MSHLRPDVGDRVAAAEAVVAEALAAFEAQDWSRLVALTDVGSIVTLQTEYLSSHRARAAPPSFLELSELFGGEDPEGLTGWAPSVRRFGELAGITTLEQAEALSPADFLVRWAQARHPHYLVGGVSAWNPDHVPERRAVIGSVALMPDTVAVVVRATNLIALNTLGALRLIAVLGDNQGGWALDASSAWLGLADIFF